MEYFSYGGKMKKVSSNTKKKTISGGGKGNRNKKEAMNLGREIYNNSLKNEDNINEELKQFLKPINRNDILNKNPNYLNEILYKLQKDKKMSNADKNNIASNLINVINDIKNRIQSNADNLLKEVKFLQNIENEFKDLMSRKINNSRLVRTNNGKLRPSENLSKKSNDWLVRKQSGELMPVQFPNIYRPYMPGRNEEFPPLSKK
jgi:hypothetical protein